MSDVGTARRSIVYLEPDHEIAPETALRFRLTYSGKLLASQGGERIGQPQRRPEHKHAIRKEFHRQLKQLWATDRFLSETTRIISRADPDPDRLIGDKSRDYGMLDDKEASLSEYVAEKYRRNGYRFVPLVRSEFAILCNIDVLMLRVDYPGSVFTAGDVDNRVKTLIDALQMPKSSDDLRGNETPEAGEDPFFCLLEDDKLITGFRVETDRLLRAGGVTEEDRSVVEMVISVEVRPYLITSMSLGFV